MKLFVVLALVALAVAVPRTKRQTLDDFEVTNDLDSRATTQTGQNTQYVPSINSGTGLAVIQQLINAFLGPLNTNAVVQAPVAGSATSNQNRDTAGPTTTGTNSTTGASLGGINLNDLSNPMALIQQLINAATSVTNLQNSPLQQLTTQLGALTGPISGIFGGPGAAKPSTGTAASSSAATYRCSAIPKSRASLGQQDVLVTIPGHTTRFDVETDEGVNHLSQVTYGYILDGQAYIHSLLAGNASAVAKFVEQKMDKITGDGLTGRSAEDPTVLDAALAEFGLRSLTDLAGNMVKSLNADAQVAAALDCQLDSFDCYLGKSEAAEIKVCSEHLVDCVKKSFEK